MSGLFPKILYHLSATTKRTSMYGGNQNGWATDTINAPPFNSF